MSVTSIIVQVNDQTFHLDLTRLLIQNCPTKSLGKNNTIFYFSNNNNCYLTTSRLGLT